ncbi:F-box protein DOR-like [Silene latifolia]|uniref:F-box protein DOR-like n=1 Tax=Silene latifolia TaxID=37657 RepID=UPI003D785D10
MEIATALVKLSCEFYNRLSRVILRGLTFNVSDVSSADFPEKIQIDILSRLPSKSLSRCKCVSKHWNDTLTIQAFLLKHSSSYDKHSKLAFVALALENNTVLRWNKIISFDLTYNSFIGGGRETSTEEVIIGYQEYFSHRLMTDHYYYNSNICNDLICLFNNSSRSVVLLNVRTQDYIRLPAMTMDEYADPLMRFWYALGFDPVNKVFKVLSINDRSKGCGTKAAILTLGTKNWKPIEYECLPCSVTEDSIYWSSNNSFCLDGVIYWVNETKIDQNAIMLTVVAFDLNHETFRDYELFGEDGGTFKYYLTSLKGCPTLFVWKEEGDEIQQFTLFNNKNPNVAWNWRSFIAHGFPKNLNYGSRWNCVAGGSILLRQVRSNEVSLRDFVNVPKDVSWSPYKWYDLEKFALE